VRKAIACWWQRGERNNSSGRDATELMSECDRRRRRRRMSPLLLVTARGRPLIFRLASSFGASSLSRFPLRDSGVDKRGISCIRPLLSRATSLLACSHGVVACLAPVALPCTYQFKLLQDLRLVLDSSVRHLSAGRSISTIICIHFGLFRIACR
jgi:hypothetical protein